jgi:hypothetical protein
MSLHFPVWAFFFFKYKVFGNIFLINSKWTVLVFCYRNFLFYLIDMLVNIAFSFQENITLGRQVSTKYHHVKVNTPMLCSRGPQLKCFRRLAVLTEVS